MSRSPLPVSRAFAVGSACVVLACSSSGPRAFDVRVAVMTHGGEPVAGAEVRVRSERPAATDATGRVTLRVSGQAGDRVPVSLRCPPGFRAAPDETDLVLPSTPPASTDAAPALGLACHLDMRDAVVLVHAAGPAPNLPVKVDGVVVGQTDSLGFAHVHVRASPATTFEVSLDTSDNVGLSPANPAQRFQMGPADDLYVFDTTLSMQKPERRPRRAANQRRARGAGVD